jgi:hypothetical protein
MATATARAVDHEDEYQRALERAVRLGVVVLERGTLADGVPFVSTTSASHPGKAHLVRAYPGRITCDCASRRDQLCTHRALASAEWAADEAERTGDEWGWRPTPKGRALAIGEEIAARAAWAREEYWAEVWASLDEGTGRRVDG